MIDPALKGQAELICATVVGQLKVEYGDRDCNTFQSQEIREVPSLKIREVF